ncbi:MAG TPA: DUF4395 family protein [bacterium]|nr:DUF4395 family protein [bacterium]
MTTRAEKNFLDQQGYLEDDKQRIWFNALQFQPTIVGSGVLIATLLQLPALFFILSAILWVNVLFPRLNPFENFYNAVIALRKNVQPVPPAPPARLFAQGMATVLMLISAVSLLAGWNLAAYIAEGLLIVAFGSLLFGKFCLGAYIYHLLKGRVSFANATCPWS